MEGMLPLTMRQKMQSLAESALGLGAVSRAIAGQEGSAVDKDFVTHITGKNEERILQVGDWAGVPISLLGT